MNITLHIQFKLNLRELNGSDGSHMSYFQPKAP